MGNAVTIHGLREFLERFLASEAEKCGGGGWWRQPLLACGAVDERFEILPKVAFKEHLLPRDLLTTARTVTALSRPSKRMTSHEAVAGSVSRKTAVRSNPSPIFLNRPTSAENAQP